MSYNIEQANSGYMALTAGGLAAGTTASQLKTVNTVTYLNNGIFKSKTAVAAITLTGTALAIGQACLFGVFLDAGGNVYVTQGPIVNAGDPCPVPPASALGATVIGLAKVTTTSAVFTPGTTLLGTGNTASYLDVALMPGTAQ